MSLSPALFYWMWRQTLPITLIALVAACSFTLFAPGQLYGPKMDFTRYSMCIWGFALAHCLTLVVCLGQWGNRGFAFVYTRGFSRDQLWAHTMLATAASVLCVWLAAGLIVWLPLRSVVQNLVFGNPYYPGAKFLDAALPLFPLAICGLLLPLAHYTWIRRFQPVRTRKLDSQMLYLVSVICLGSMVAGSPLVFPSWMLATMLAMSALFFCWSWRLHRRLEIAPTTASKFAPLPDRRTRALETLVVIVMGAFMLLTIPVNGRDFVLVLDDVHPEAARAYLLTIAVGFAGVLIGAAFVASGRGTGAFISFWTVLLCSFSITISPEGWFAHPEPLFQRWIRPGVDFRMAYYTLGDDPDNRGAELYVNGVNLGPVPVTITLNDFWDRVPQWPQDEKDLTEEHHPVGLAGEKDRWYRFYMDRQGPSGDVFDRHARCYAQIRLDGEWGTIADGNPATLRELDHHREFADGRDGRDDYIHYVSTRFKTGFPRRDARIRRHLRALRQADGQVDAEWLQETDGYGRRAWQLLQENIANAPDPRMLQALDDWATWRYGLDKAVDADAAWQILERIRHEVDTQGDYHTDSIAGTAVEMLVPNLDPSRLVTEAEYLLAGGTYNHLYSYRRKYGRMHLSTRLRNRPGSNVGHKRWNQSRLPLSAFVVAHAVWKMDEHLDEQDDSATNIIENRVLPNFVYRSRHDRLYLRQGYERYDRSLDVAAALGWPGLYRFLTRHDWVQSIGPLNSRDRNADRLEGVDVLVNKWFYRLLTLPTPEGRRFRREHESEMFSLALQIATARSHGSKVETLKFLFLDPDVGKDWAALKFWRRGLIGHFDRLGYRYEADRYVRFLFEYLAEMEPHSTVEMYLEVWRMAPGYPSVPTDVLDALPPPKRLEVLETMLAEIENRIANPKPESKRGHVNHDVLNGQVLQDLRAKIRDLRKTL